MSKSICYGLVLLAFIATTAQATSVPKTDSLVTARTASLQSHGDSRSFGLLTTLLLTSLPGLLLLLLLIPIPVLRPFAAAAATAPFFAGRRNADGNPVNGVDLWRMRSALEANSCVQRVTCEMIKSSEAEASPGWVRRVLSGIPLSQELKSKVSNASDGLRQCTRIKCDPVSSFRNMFS